jgi:RNA polymerase sigma-70 factor, ECF subfamily
MTMTEAMAATADRPPARALPGRRRERAAGERIAALYEEHGRLVYGVCRLMLRDPVEAEDAAQQTFLSAYRALLGGQEPREPSAWLGTIARNECRTRLRGRRTEPLTLVREPVGDELQREVDRHAEIQALCAALAELPPQQRDAIVLREFYGLSYAEVGAALGLSGAAASRSSFGAASACRTSCARRAPL